VADDEQFWEVFNRSPTAVLLTNDDGLCLEANDGAVRALGRERADIIGRRITELAAPDQRRDATRLWQRYRDNGHLVVPWEVRRPGVRLPGVVVMAPAEVDGTRRHVAVLVEEAAINGTAMLSPREREVTRLLASGLTGEEIARALVLSPETVRTHIRNAMESLGAKTRAHLVALAMRSPP
jgi:PAS domain S-box-containing protein